MFGPFLSMPSLRRTGLGAAVAATALLLAACGTNAGGSDTSVAAPPPSAAAPSAAPAGASSPSAATSLDPAQDVCTMTAAAGLKSKLPSSIQSKGYISGIIQPEFEPFEWIDPDTNKLQGIDVDLSQCIAKTIGIDYKYTQTQDFEQVIPSVQTGRVDVAMSGTLDTKDRQDVVDIVDYMMSGSSFITLASKSDINTLTDLCGKTIVTGAGSNYPSQLQQLSGTICAGKDPIKPLPMSGTFKTDVQQLTLGRADAYYSSLDANAYDMEQAPGTYKQIGAGQFLSQRWGILVNKNQGDLATVLQTALNDMIAQGSYDKILDKWGFSSLALKKSTIDGATS